MKRRWRNFLLATALTGAAVASILGQASARAAERTNITASGAASIPDFSGFWAHPFLGFEFPLSGPGPVRNKSRRPNGTSNTDQLVGDYTNPILKPEAAEIVKKRGEISLSGRAYPDPDNQCLQNPLPYIFWNFEIQILQQKDKVTILYPHDQDHRDVRMNQSHPAKVTPSLHGDSVGHYEGDTLIIDTVGIKAGKYTMIDRLGTPYTEALHVIERYRLIDYEAARQAQERAAKEWTMIGGGPYAVDANYRGKGLQLEFTVEDQGVFTMPWSAIISYRRAANAEWDERVCAENVGNYYSGQYYSDADARPPTAEKPDF